MGEKASDFVISPSGCLHMACQLPEIWHGPGVCIIDECDHWNDPWICVTNKPLNYVMQSVNYLEVILDKPWKYLKYLMIFPCNWWFFKLQWRIYMWQETRLSLVQIMVCHVFGTKPLSEPLLTYWQLNKFKWNLYEYIYMYNMYGPWYVHDQWEKKSFGSDSSLLVSDLSLKIKWNKHYFKCLNKKG